MQTCVIPASTRDYIPQIIPDFLLCNRAQCIFQQPHCAHLESTGSAPRTGRFERLPVSKEFSSLPPLNEGFALQGFALRPPLYRSTCAASTVGSLRVLQRMKSIFRVYNLFIAACRNFLARVLCRETFISGWARASLDYSEKNEDPRFCARKLFLRID